MARRIILDCDPGHDDAIAMLLAHGSPEIELAAVTTVAGNQTLDKVTRNARSVATLAGITGVPIAAGLRPPAAADRCRGTTSTASPAWTAPCCPNRPCRSIRGTAVDLIIETVMARAG